MRKPAFVATVAITLIVAAAAPTTQPSAFDAYFTDRTMRMDYVHSGGLGQEIVALDRVVADGPWAGSRTRLVDDLNLGKYLFEVVDRNTNRTIYSRGFASVYGEWETTAEYRRVHRSFGESLRFPWPKAPVQVVLKKRDRDNSFREFWSTVIDPNSRFVNGADPPKAGAVWTSSRAGRRSRRSTFCSSAKGTRPPRCRSSMPMRSGWSTRSSPWSRSRAVRASSMYGVSICPPANQG